jgi:hypothetical protein
VSNGDSYYRIEATEGMTEYHTIGGFHPLSMCVFATHNAKRSTLL